MSDKAQLAALGAHLSQQQPIGVVYRAEGKRFAVAEVEAAAIGSKVYTAAELAAMAAEWEELRRPETAEEAREAAQASVRMEARREIVRAALAWIRSHEPMECEECNRLVQAVKAFREAGGSEVDECDLRE